MKASVLALGLLTPLALAFAQPADQLRYGVADGTILEKSYVTKVELALDDMRMVQNGQEMDASMMGLEMTVATSAEYIWQDVYGPARDGGRPASLTRTFDTLSNDTSTSQTTAMTGGMELDIGSSSELTDETVIFTWDGDEGAYVASFPEDSGADEELLEGLEAETDLTFLLPDGDVEVDAEWMVDADHLAALLGPGGDLKLLPNDEDLPEEARGQGTGSEFSMAEMLGETDGEIKCTYLGMREDDDGTFMVIKVEMDVSSSNDMTEMMRESIAEVETEEGTPQIDFNSVDTELVIEGEGELVWDSARGHFVAFTFSGEMEQTMDMSMSMQMGTMEMEMEQTISLVGSVDLDFSAIEE